jgi:hypothetical protein
MREVAVKRVSGFARVLLFTTAAIELFTIALISAGVDQVADVAPFARHPLRPRRSTQPPGTRVIAVALVALIGAGVCGIVAAGLFALEIVAVLVMVFPTPTQRRSSSWFCRPMPPFRSC